MKKTPILLLYFGVLLMVLASAQESPKPNLLPQLCFSMATKCLPDSKGFEASVINSCGLSNNPVAHIVLFQQTSNFVDWQTFLVLTNVPLYGCTATNLYPYKPVCFMRVAVYP